MEEDQLYFKHDHKLKAIHLNFPFITIKSSLETEKNTCYFYNIIIKDKARFISYHIELEDDRFIDLDELKTLRLLLKK